MEFCIIDKNNEEYSELVQKSGILFQTFEWIISNHIDEYFACYIKEEHGVNIGGLAIINHDREESVKTLYFPKGPIILESNEEKINFFINNVIKLAKSQGCQCIRFDYIAEIGQNEDIERIFKSNGFESSIFSNFWDYTWQIDISNINEYEYIADLKEKTRYHINYAKRHGVETLIDNSDESIEKFYNLLQITSARDDFIIKTKECYKDIMKNFKKEANLFWCYKDNELLSAAIEIIIGSTAYYIFGASSNNNRNLKSTYLLQYEMITRAIQKKCKIYDMGGVRNKN